MSPLVKRRIFGVLAAGAVKWTLTFILIEVLDFWVGLTTPASWTIGITIGTAVGIWILVQLWRVRPSDRVAKAPVDVSVPSKGASSGVAGEAANGAPVRLGSPIAAQSDHGPSKSPGVMTVEAKLTKQSV